jgi:chemotaxis protein MotA
MSTDNPKSFIDPHGGLIVIGGSVAATAISFQIDRVLLMVKVFWRRTILGKKPNYVKTIRYLMALAESYRKGGSDIEKIAQESGDDFLIEAMSILTDEVVSPDHVYVLLKKRTATIYERYHSDAGKFRAMGKYPPAMGLMGAVLGMIALLGGLGKPGAEATVGPAMSVALIATFYGIALANLVVIPIGENLADGAKEVKVKNLIIAEGVKLIAQKIPPIVLAEELNSYLLPGQRVDWKKI